jgi:hypothetical protein
MYKSFMAADTCKTDSDLYRPTSTQFTKNYMTSDHFRNATKDLPQELIHQVKCENKNGKKKHTHSLSPSVTLLGAILRSTKKTQTKSLSVSLSISPFKNS